MDIYWRKRERGAATLILPQYYHITIFPPSRVTNIKTACDNGTYREFIIYIIKKKIKIYAKMFKPIMTLT